MLDGSYLSKMILLFGTNLILKLFSFCEFPVEIRMGDIALKFFFLQHDCACEKSILVVVQDIVDLHANYNLGSIYY